MFGLVVLEIACVIFINNAPFFHWNLQWVWLSISIITQRPRFCSTCIWEERLCTENINKACYDILLETSYLILDMILLITYFSSILILVYINNCEDSVYSYHLKKSLSSWIVTFKTELCFQKVSSLILTQHFLANQTCKW